MRPVAVVVLDVLVDDGFKVTSAYDEPAIDALPANEATNRSAKALARGARIGARMVRMPWEQKTSSKLAVNLVSRSLIRNLTGRPRWASS
jgi:hypothetical protein